VSTAPSAGACFHLPLAAVFYEAPDTMPEYVKLFIEAVRGK